MYPLCIRCNTVRQLWWACVKLWWGASLCCDTAGDSAALAAPNVISRSWYPHLQIMYCVLSGCLLIPRLYTINGAGMVVASMLNAFHETTALFRLCIQAALAPPFSPLLYCSDRAIPGPEVDEFSQHHINTCFLYKHKLSKWCVMLQPSVSTWARPTGM